MLVVPYSESTLREALDILRSGGVVAHATETCYGFACDLSNLDAVRTLFRIKRRPADQPVSALFPSIDEAKKYVIWNDRAEELAAMYLPGPLTLILPMRTDAPSQLFSIAEIRNSEFRIQRSLGIRISSHPHARSLIAAFASPLSTTSANLHGQPNPYSADDILAQCSAMPDRPDLILDSGKLPPTPPSTVIDCTSEALTKRREGGLAI